MDAKEAVKLAIDAVTDAYNATETITRDIRLEEFEKAAVGNWLITISFIQPEPVPSGTNVSVGDLFKALGATPVVRLYKTIEIDSNGQVLSMKMRTTDV